MTGDKGIQHIIWDWNGTLFNDSGAMIDATIHAFSVTGLSEVDVTTYQQHYMRPIPEFYNRLARRRLSDAEQRLLAKHYREAYENKLGGLTVAPAATDSLTQWQGVGGSQSVLSMHPHDELVRLAAQAGVMDFFTRVDGAVVENHDASKAPHLARHIARLAVDPEWILLVGDSVDDMMAARACGIRALSYHAGKTALHARWHFDGLGIPVVTCLREAVRHAFTHR
jgi:phosphoglycolate phosphatase-like HAD superfamily hydrolase